jgi:signal transduction histidine kinase
MWFFRHIVLNCPAARVDIQSTMLTQNHTADRDGASETPTSHSQLVHELANLLDGSLRNVSLVASNLHAQQVIDDHLVERLDAADVALQQMAGLLRRWMHLQRGKPSLYTQAGSLGSAIDQAVRLLEPAAASLRITLNTTVAESARHLPVGPLYPIIANALNNALEAIAGQEVSLCDRHLVDLDCRVNGDLVILTIDDTGPGVDPQMLDAEGRPTPGRTTKPQGHGLGLSLSTEIAAAIGADIELTSRSERGARFVLCCPIDQLQHTGARPMAVPRPRYEAA